MQSSAAPVKIQVPFANGGSKNTIPVSSQIGVTAGAASFTDGFPPLTRTPLAAGGVPPSGADMNGILNAITAVLQWQSAGGLFKFDSAFSTAIGGYPKGAVLESSTGLTQWRNTIEGNTTDPDSASAAGWISVEGALAGFTSYTGSQTISVAQSGSMVGYASTSAPGTFTLPAPGSMAALTYTFTNYSSYPLTLSTPSGAFTRGGGNSTFLVPAGTGIVIASDGVNWQILHGDAALQTSPFFGSSKSTNGYQKLPSGIIVQWATAFISTNQSISLPISFPNSTITSIANVANGAAWPISNTNSSVLIGHNASGAQSCVVWAIGN